MVKDKMFLLVKPTHECNLDCEYCYDRQEKDVVKTKIISDKTITKIAELINNTYAQTQFVWHGGEPLLAGIDNFKKWHDIIFEKTTSVNKISFGMQSNGNLYNEEVSSELENLHISYSISYDIINDNAKRRNAKKIYEIDPLGKISALAVVDYDSSFKLIDNYEAMKFINRKVTLNKIFLDDKTNDNIETYTENWVEFFKHVIFDKEAVKKEETFFSFFNKIFAMDKSKSVCSNTNCINNFLSVNPDGDIFPCDRFGKVNASDYCYGNVNEYKFSFNEYMFSDGYKKYEHDTLEALKKCAVCDVNVWCGGGCKANRVNSEGIIDVSEPNKYDCIFYKRVYNFIFDTIYNLSPSDLLDINPFVYQAIFNDKIFLKFMIDRIKGAEIVDKFNVN